MKFFPGVRKLFLIFAQCLFLSAPFFAEIAFSAPNINDSDEVLFALKAEVPGSLGYSTIFRGKIKDGGAAYFPRAVTCFPEKLEAFEGAKKLQVRNRFGRAVYDFEKETLTWQSHAPSIPENAAAPLPVAMSATGKWFCEVERKDLFKGRLLITESATGKRIVLNENSGFSYSSVPVKWSPDGNSFVYEKDGGVFFCNPEKLFKDVLVEEKFRRIGNGSIHCIAWNDAHTITYISSDLIFRIDSREMISLGLYANFIQLGKIVGRLPHRFDSVSDRFWVNVRGDEFVVIRGDEMISYYKTKEGQEGGAFVNILYSCSFVESGSVPLAFNVFWSPAGEASLCAKLSEEGTGHQSSAIYTISPYGRMSRRIFVKDTHNGISVSPDGMFIAITTGEDIYIYSVKTWKLAHSIKGERVVTLAWRDNGSLCIGGVRSVKKLSLTDFTSKELFSSSATDAFWTEDGRVVVQDSEKKKFVLSVDGKSWSEYGLEERPKVFRQSVQNDSYRVFCGSTRNALYKNALYVRTLSGKITTRAVVAKSAMPVPARKKAAIVFDADETADGLNAVLAICNNYNIRCTFFFNGEFIRRYPEETKQIAQTGHECAAIFFNNIDLTDRAVYFDEKFISKGLARLEDEFFQCTGRELSLFWHAPFNRSDEKIRAEASQAGYTYVEMERPNIIPINAGNIISGSILYERFDLMINELLATGADVVTISRLE